MKTIDNLIPGRVFKVGNQGMNISPQTISVEIHWVDAKSVHYIVLGDYGHSNIRETSVERFLGILNGGMTSYEEDE